ncbi:phosphoglycerate kinase, partial [Staphylococcus epidermidis]|uniref:phosphoglycerate kinase n=1 Tax=Staphylococcus epidermidis TaxID=1282 RepID=UPI001642958B
IVKQNNFNIEIKNHKINNHKTIVQPLPTIQYIIEQRRKLLLFSHLPKLKQDSHKQPLSLKPLPQNLSNKLPKQLIFLPQTPPQKLQTPIQNLNEAHLLLLQNTPFQDLHPKKQS